MTDTSPAVPALHDAEPPTFLGHAVVQLAHLLGREMDRRLAPLKLSATGFSALFHLHHTPHISAAELARRILITPQSVGPLLDSLERHSLVERDRSAGPGVAVTTRITTAGSTALTQALTTVQALDAELATGLPATHRGITASSLDHMLAHLRR